LVSADGAGSESLVSVLKNKVKAAKVSDETRAIVDAL